MNVEAQDHGSGEVDRTVSVRPFQLEDIDALRQVMRTAVVNPITREVIEDEIEEDVESLRASVEDPNSPKKYFVAESPEGEVIGMMGMAEPEKTMRDFATTTNPVEIINAYVSSATRQTGAGRSLVERIEAEARAKGYTETILNSGPRYTFSGWPFWQKMYGDRIGTAEKYYDGQWDAPVWHKEL